jgi:hypothetical protein
MTPYRGALRRQFQSPVEQPDPTPMPGAAGAMTALGKTPATPGFAGGSLGAMSRGGGGNAAGEPPDPLLGRGGGLGGARGIRRGHARLGWQNARQASGELWNAYNRLMNEANSGLDSNAVAMRVAPDLETISDLEQSALDGSEQDALARGLDESTFASAERGQIRGEGARTRSNLFSGVYRQMEGERRNALQQALGILGGFSGQAGLSLSAANAMRQDRLQSQAQEGGSWLDDLFAIGGHLGGAYLGRRR